MKIPFPAALALSLPITTAALADTVPKFKRLKLTDKFYAEGAAAGDFNKDGKMDVISGPYWYAGPDYKVSQRRSTSTKDFQAEGILQELQHLGARHQW